MTRSRIKDHMLRFLKTYGFLLIIPTTVTVMCFLLRFATGPFWQYCDPNYIYLFSSLHMVKGLAPTFVYHPGVPLQILMLMVMWIVNIGHSASETINNVLLQPELYLNITHALLVIGVFLTYCLLAIYVFHRTKSGAAALLTQLPGLAILIIKSFESDLAIIPISANVSPELLLVSIVNLFTLGFIALYLAEDPKQQMRLAILLGLLCGFGLSTRLIFFTLVLSAFIAVPGRMRVLFSLTCLASFLVWTLPIIHRYPAMLDWAKNVITHTGAYGGGHHNPVAWKESLDHFFNDILVQYWFFISLALGSLFLSFLQLHKERENKNARFLAAISFGILLHFIMICKHFSWHYLTLGVASMSGLLFLLYANNLSQNKILKQATIAFILIFTIQNTAQAILYRNESEALKNEVVGFHERISKQYQNSTIIASNSKVISLFLSPEFALFFGNRCGLHKESNELQKAYPYSYYYNVDNVDPGEDDGYGIWNSKGRVFADDILNSRSPVVILTGEDLEGSAYQVQPIEKNYFANAYLLTGSTEKEANKLFELAQDALKNNDLPKAFALALRSKQLNYAPKDKIDFLLTLIYHQLQRK